MPRFFLMFVKAAALCRWHSVGMLCRRRFPALLLLLLTALATACAAPPPPGLNAEPLQLLTDLDPEGVFALSPDGEQLAFGRNGLRLLERASGQLRQLAAGSPLALAWRRDGAELAAGFVDEQGESRLAVFDRRGALLSEQPLPGRLLSLSWSARHDLLAFGYQLKVYSFGANLTQWLVRSDAQTTTTIVLGDVTLRPATAKRLAKDLPALLAAAFSPDGDELVFLRLHDPPEFSPYLRLLYRNWQAPGERKLLDLALQPVAIDWEPTGEAIVWWYGAQQPQRFELWPPPASTPQPAVVSLIPARASDPASRLQFLDDGRYLLATAGRLYLGEGLPVRQRPAYDEALWQLRKWRFEELISAEEFREARP